MHPSPPRHTRAAVTAAAALFPEITVAVTLFTLARDRVRGTDRERGDVVQWVILAAIGAAIAITVGTIIFNKVRDKANTITTDTPAANTGP